MKNKFNDFVQDVETYIMIKIKQKAQQLLPELEKKNRLPISLSMGAPTQLVPQIAIDKLIESLNIENIHTYSSPRGEDFYLKSVQKRMSDRFNVNLNYKTQICSLIGSKEGLANFIRILINPKNDKFEKDIILVPDPGYASYVNMIEISGGLPFSVPLLRENNYMPNLNNVLEDVKKQGFNPEKIKALIINYPNNPLGINANREYLSYVVKFCKENNIILISDAAYCDIYFGDENKPSSIFECEDAIDIAVEFHSFSKPFAMTGWRIGWVCGNDEMISIFAKYKSSVDTGIYKAIQYAASEILNSKEGDKYIKDSNINYKRKQDIMVNGFKELGWDFSNIQIPNTTFYLWLPIPKKYKTSNEFTNLVLEKSGILLVPGSAFGKFGEGWFRVSNVASDKKLYEVISRLKEDGFYYN